MSELHEGAVKSEVPDTVFTRESRELSVEPSFATTTTIRIHAKDTPTPTTSICTITEPGRR